MNQRITLRYRLLLLLATLALWLPPTPALALTQQEWMTTLVDALGLSFGLPDTPTPQDYINILSGKRNLRFEAEEFSSPDDSVSKMALPNFGPFSGQGWLLGISRPTDVHLNFVVPRDGEYRLALTLRSPGHTVKVAGQTFPADGSGDKFTSVDLGAVTLAAGPTMVVVTLPPGGALDAISLTAPNLASIAPGPGWQPETVLTWEAVATTLMQALNLAEKLPLASDPPLMLEAEEVKEIGAARLVEDSHLGAPSGGRWLRTSVQPVTVRMPVNLPAAGFFDLSMVAMGAPITVRFNDHLELSATGKAYLDELTLPPVYLPAGSNELTITLPPRGGLDRLMLKPRQTTLESLNAVLELQASGEAPAPADLDRLSARLLTTAR